MKSEDKSENVGALTSPFARRHRLAPLVKAHLEELFPHLSRLPKHVSSMEEPETTSDRQKSGSSTGIQVDAETNNETSNVDVEPEMAYYDNYISPEDSESDGESGSESDGGPSSESDGESRQPTPQVYSPPEEQGASQRKDKGKGKEFLGTRLSMLGPLGPSFGTPASPQNVPQREDVGVYGEQHQCVDDGGRQEEQQRKTREQSRKQKAEPPWTLEEYTSWENPVDLSRFEKIEHYSLGGLHPVHIGDILDNRFQVVNKLGNGGFATVWLCLERTSKNWRAVKILSARDSTKGSFDMKLKGALERQGVPPWEWESAHIVLPQETFWIEGPNGRHLCLVLPVLGPDLLELRPWRTKTPNPSGSKRVFHQALQALEFLHEHNTVHGDFRPENILLRLNSIYMYDLDEMNERLGEPETVAITLPGITPQERQKKKGQLSVPMYLVRPARMGRFGFRHDIAVVDFGEAFNTRRPRDFVGLPHLYTPPEVVYHSEKTTLGPAVDIWSLAVTLFKIRVQMTPFNPGRNDLVCAVYYESLLGPMPQVYKTVWHRKDRERIQRGERTLTAISRHRNRKDDDAHFEQPLFFGFAKFRQWDLEREIEGYKDSFDEYLAYDTSHYVLAPEVRAQIPTDSPTWLLFKISKEEIPILADLLNQMIRYDPAERSSAASLLKHPWFEDRMEQGETVDVGTSFDDSSTDSNSSQRTGSSADGNGAQSFADGDEVQDIASTIASNGSSAFVPDPTEPGPFDPNEEAVDGAVGRNEEGTTGERLEGYQADDESTDFEDEERAATHGDSGPATSTRPCYCGPSSISDDVVQIAIPRRLYDAVYHIMVGASVASILWFISLMIFALWLLFGESFSWGGHKVTVLTEESFGQLLPNLDGWWALIVL